MITVIKHGNKKSKICKVCDCEFLYEAEDIKTRDNGRNDYEYYIPCPDCYSEVKLEWNKGEVM